MLKRMLMTLLVLGSTVLIAGGCGDKKCKTDKDCQSSGKDGSKICYEGRCVSLKGESGKAAPSPGGRRQVDPKATFKVLVDLKKNPSKGPAAAPVTVAPRKARRLDLAGARTSGGAGVSGVCRLSGVSSGLDSVDTGNLLFWAGDAQTVDPYHEETRRSLRRS